MIGNAAHSFHVFFNEACERLKLLFPLQPLSIVVYMLASEDAVAWNAVAITELSLVFALFGADNSKCTRRPSNLCCHKYPAINVHVFLSKEIY